MRRLFAAATAVVLAIAPVSARADDYPEQVYTSSAPNGPDWLALASPQGTWAIQVGEGCP
jgi:hypothetical protein